MKKYQDRLKEIREDRKVSQSKLERVLKTTQQQYSKYETGTQELPLYRAVELDIL